jgi:hypothetical protein
MAPRTGCTAVNPTKRAADKAAFPAPVRNDLTDPGKLLFTPADLITGGWMIVAASLMTGEEASASLLGTIRGRTSVA